MQRSNYVFYPDGNANSKTQSTLFFELDYKELLISILIYVNIGILAGLANIRVICAKGSVSVNREWGEYATTFTASHELGHK